MNSNPLVSIVTPVYNQEKFIGETMQSVISQSYQNWELLVVDDCSTDGSWDIIQEYARKDDRIRAFRNEKNKGLIPNWKFLIDNSKGEYLAFLEGDDVFCKENLTEKMIIFSKYSDLGMVYCDFKIIDGGGKTLIDDVYKKLKTVTYKNKKINPLEYLYAKSLLFSTYSQIMIKRSILSITGYPRSFTPDEKIFLPSDWDFNFRVSTKNKVYCIDSVLLQYRKHSNNNSAETHRVSRHLSLILDDYEREFSENIKIQKAIKYMRGKICYFDIIFCLENDLKKEAWQKFLFYINKYYINFLRDFRMNFLMFIRLFLSNKINLIIKKIYLGKIYG